MRKGSGGGRKEKVRPDVKEHLIPNCQKPTTREVSNFLLWRCLKANVNRSSGLSPGGWWCAAGAGGAGGGSLGGRVLHGSVPQGK